MKARPKGKMYAAYDKLDACGKQEFWRTGKVRILHQLPYKEPDPETTTRFIEKVLEVRPLLNEPRIIVMKSRIHDEDVAGVIIEEGEPIKLVTKIVVKPKIDWLAINREMSNGSY